MLLQLLSVSVNHRMPFTNMCEAPDHLLVLCLCVLWLPGDISIRLLVHVYMKKWKQRWRRIGSLPVLSAGLCISLSGTIMTLSGGGQMTLGPRITTSRISDECLTTDPPWVTMARDPQTITALSIQTNWGNTNNPCLHCTPRSQTLAHLLPRNLPMILSHPWITGLLWRDH